MESKLYILLFVFSLLVGCASLKERAAEHLNSGNYESAIQNYQEFLSQFPNDAEALSGLRQAQRRQIDSQLLQVRLLRLAGNLGESEVLLLQILAKEKEWQVFPTGVVFSTQKEEEEYFYTRQIEKIEAALKDQKPILAKYLMTKSKPVFSGALGKNTTILETKIDSEGRNFCMKEARLAKSTEYFRGVWVDTLCKYWDSRQKPVKRKNTVQMLRNLNPKFEIENVDSAGLEQLTKTFRDSFRLSKWHDADSKFDWNLQIKGSLSDNIQSKSINKSAPYTVQIPYEESHIETKKAKESTSLLSAIFTLLVGSSGPREVDNGDGTVTVYEKKYRTEYRQFDYTAVEFEQNLNLEMKTKSELAGKAFVMEFQDKFSKTSLEHQNNFPEAKVYPESRVILSHNDFIAKAAGAFFQFFSEKLALAWEERFCIFTLSSKDKEADNEVVNRCAYGLSGRSVGAVDEWYVTKTGVDLNTWRGLLALKGL